MSALVGVGHHLTTGLARTWRLEIAGEDAVRCLRAAGERLIFAVWHGSLLAPLWHRREEGITLLVSSHPDATYLAAAAAKWGYHVVRGSTRRGGVGGLHGIVRALAAGRDAAFTPDGPRGPARAVKPGAVAAAQHAGAALVPVGVAASREWRCRSWDRFEVPRPLARVRIVYGDPIGVGRGGTAREKGRRCLEAGLRAAERAACAP